jgi:adenylate cyclase
LKRLLSLDPKLAEAHASRGVALAAGKKYEEAKEEFEKALALNPESYEAHYFYARSDVAQGNLNHPRYQKLFERIDKS